ncbi:hypothetical protein H0H93_009112 [Arthromyces matolae]|nr:hypothetical protein H0H93_009112 [Arthromyces matolae]
MLPFPISEDWSSLSSQNLAATLRARAMTSTSREEQAIVNMWIMNVVFEKKLKELDWAASVDLLKPWLKEMQNFALEEGVWNSALVQTWTTKLTTQMEAMASLQQGKVQQAIWDGYWIDDDHLHTTRLKGGPIDIPHKHQAGKVLYINKKDLPPGKSEQLESANLFSTLLNIADSSLSSKRGTINGLFLLRKGIQMWMKSGMKKDEFDQREKKLREIVMNRTPANQLRAEMVFISLRRFMKDQKIQLIG